jgi:membrane-bound lytic murein transglycosylase D
MKNRKNFISLLLVIGLAAITSLISYRYKVTHATTSNNFTKFRYDLPANLNFCGERIPVSDFDSRSLFDSTLHAYTYGVSHSKELLARAKQWFPVIEPILRKNNLPSDLKYVALVESGFNINTSSKGAEGYWQFMAATAGNYGLTINEEIDERYDMEKSTLAACRFFLQSYKELKSWTLSAAAYNMGLPALQKRMQKQNASSYYDMLLNRETAGYMYRILALKTVVENPEKYGYKLSRKNYYPRLNVLALKIDSSVSDLSQLAQRYRTTVETIRIMNPWIKGNALTNVEKHVYWLHIPKDTTLNNSYLAAIMGFTKQGDPDSTKTTIDSTAGKHK